jgi:DNA invertase Pin-like site-specific DNA recombinase
MAVVGYARVSSIGQSLELQIEKLKLYGCTKLYTEKKTALDQKRPELLKCLDFVRDSDDTLVITKLDRVARSSLHLGKIVDQLQEKSVNLIVLDQNIDTTTIYGRLTFQILSAVAEFENEIRRERQKEGIQKAKRDGKQLGRKRTITDKIVKSVLEDTTNNLTISTILKNNAISNGTYYRIKHGDYNHLLLTRLDKAKKS